MRDLRCGDGCALVIIITASIVILTILVMLMAMAAVVEMLLLIAIDVTMLVLILMTSLAIAMLIRQHDLHIVFANILYLYIVYEGRDFLNGCHSVFRVMYPATAFQAACSCVFRTFGVAFQFVVTMMIMMITTRALLKADVCDRAFVVHLCDLHLPRCAVGVEL